jgi:hypothetical protein
MVKTRQHTRITIPVAAPITNGFCVILFFIIGH